MGRRQLIFVFSQPRSGCVRVRAWSALLYPGPLWCGGRVEESPQDGPHGCGPVLRRHTEVPSENPATRPRTRSPWMGGGRAIGVSFSLGDLSLTPGIHALRPSGRLRRSHVLLHARGQAKEKSLGRRQALETALKLARARKQKPPSPQPSSPTMKLLGERESARAPQRGGAAGGI